MKGHLKKRSKLFAFFPSLIFNIYFILVTLIVGGGGLMISVFHRRLACFVGFIWAHSILFGLRLICGIKHEIVGRENIPKNSCIVASKHQSTWDTVFLLVLLRDPVFVLKKTLCYFPIFGWYLILMEMIAINRSKFKEAINIISKESKKRLKQGRKVVIFPEGTRTKPGARVNYKSGIFKVAKDADEYILPIALNSGVFWPKNSFYKYRGTIKVRVLKKIKLEDNKKNFMKLLENLIENSNNL